MAGWIVEIKVFPASLGTSSSEGGLIWVIMFASAKTWAFDRTTAPASKYAESLKEALSPATGERQQKNKRMGKGRFLVTNALHPVCPDKERQHNKN
jgi:hypothetical protein